MTTLCNEFHRQGLNIEVLQTTNIPATYKLNEAIPVIPVYSNWNSKLKIIDKVRKIRDYIRKNRDCVYVSFLPYDCVYTYVAAIGLRIRLICSLRNDPKQFQKRIHQFLYKKVYPYAAHVVFQTEEARAYFPDSVRRSGVIISNPISADLPAIYEGERNKEFVAVGRMIQQKNYPMLIRAYARVHKRYPDWKLRIYGVGSHEESIRKYVNQYGIADAVLFEGFVENIPDHIKKAGAFVMTSDFEGISNAMLEALAMGLPCICTDCPVGGPRTYIQDGVTGFLSPVGDEKAFAEKMIYVIEHPDEMKAFTENLRDFRQSISVCEIAEQWKKVLWN